jgi:hypothetical protein
MTAEKPPETDYTAMEGHEMLRALGDDASKWATAFRQMAIRLGYSDMDEGWLIGWFANAIEHSSDVRHWRSQSATKPVVSSFPQPQG